MIVFYTSVIPVGEIWANPDDIEKINALLTR